MIFDNIIISNFFTKTWCNRFMKCSIYFFKWTIVEGFLPDTFYRTDCCFDELNIKILTKKPNKNLFATLFFLM